MPNLEFLKGVGPKTLSLLNKLNLYEVEDLVTHYPYRFEVLKRSDVSMLNQDDKIIIDGIIETLPTLYRFKGNMNKMQFNINIGTNILKVVIGISVGILYYIIISKLTRSAELHDLVSLLKLK